jgi:hypothetical protein
MLKLDLLRRLRKSTTKPLRELAQARSSQGMLRQLLPPPNGAEAALVPAATLARRGGGDFRSRCEA